jgi:uncharacterized protein
MVFDTNVLLAGMFTHGVCEGLLDYCLASDRHAIVVSKYILDEFVRVAVRKFRVPTSVAEEAAQKLLMQTESVRPMRVEPGACRDAEDLPILGTLLAAEADYLVTGDRDLLDLKTFQSIPIISPRAMHERLA